MAPRARIRLDYRAIGAVMQSRPVRDALVERARPIAASARAIAAAEGLEEMAAAIGIEEGTRPRGRPYAQVVADHPRGTEYEFGSSAIEARRVLGRAAGVQI